MDRLAEMWKIQAKFNRNFIDPSAASNDEKIAFAKEMLLHIVSEVDELLSSTGGWKKFRFGNSPPIISGIVEELVDMWKFLIDIADAYGISSKEFFEEFVKKSTVVEERFRWENLLFNLKPEDKVAAIDLDGVLAKYPESWIGFLNDELGTNYTLRDFEFCGAPLPSIPRKRYYELKHKFRDIGFETLIPRPFDDASSFTSELNKSGFKIIILSARPYKKYKRIQGDTVRWMKRYWILYDAFLWSEEKHIRILEEVPQLSFMVEDNLRIAQEVAALGYRVFLRDRPYNQGEINSPNITRVGRLNEIFEVIV